jgi:short-subunit dehydrogenase
MEINGKRIVITGAASGIGKAIMTELATHYHADILAVDINEAGLKQAIAEVQHNSDERIFPFVTDISLKQNVDALFDYALETMVTIDIFFANVGFGYYQKIEHPDWEQIDAIFRTNVYSPFYSLEKMKKINAGREYMVVFTASVASKMGFPAYSLYAATKAALDRFAESYRFEMEKNAHLMLVYPIATRTNFFRTWEAAMPEPNQSPEHVARAVVKGVLANKRAVWPAKYVLPGLLFHTLIPTMRPYQWGLNLQFKDWMRKRRAQGKPVQKAAPEPQLTAPEAINAFTSAEPTRRGLM